MVDRTLRGKTRAKSVFVWEPHALDQKSTSAGVYEPSVYAGAMPVFWLFSGDPRSWHVYTLQRRALSHRGVPDIIRDMLLWTAMSDGAARFPERCSSAACELLLTFKISSKKTQIHGNAKFKCKSSSYAFGKECARTAGDCPPLPLPPKINVVVVSNRTPRKKNSDARLAPRCFQH